MINNITPNSKDIHICTKREKQTGKTKSQVKKNKQKRDTTKWLKRRKDHS